MTLRCPTTGKHDHSISPRSSYLLPISRVRFHSLDLQRARARRYPTRAAATPAHPTVDAQFFLLKNTQQPGNVRTREQQTASKRNRHHYYEQFQAGGDERHQHLAHDQRDDQRRQRVRFMSERTTETQSTNTTIDNKRSYYNRRKKNMRRIDSTNRRHART